MNETYQNRITDQICKIQNDRALIAFYDRLRYAPLGSYAQLHAKGEYQENGHKVPTVPETGISSPVSTWHRNRSSSS